jgi:protein gp37
MVENTKIEWTDHTFNPWTGCTRVSPGCDHCYAEAMSKRNPGSFGSWDPGASRKRTGLSYWHQPHRWNKAAEKAGRRQRVFCASMADVFDNKAPEEWRDDLFEVIRSTPHLDWLLLTKRPQNIARMLPADWRDGYANVWLGTTVEDMARARQRIPVLQSVPAVVRFLSCEPLLEGLDLNPWLARGGLHWVIAGGESGPGFRAVDADWMRSLRFQCMGSGTAFFAKQMAGARKPREGTKQEAVLAMLRRPEGATVAQIAEATGWAPHTVRGFFAGLKKRQGITVEVRERVRQVGPNKEGARGSYTVYHLPA